MAERKVVWVVKGLDYGPAFDDKLAMWDETFLETRPFCPPAILSSGPQKSRAAWRIPLASDTPIKAIDSAGRPHPDLAGHPNK